MRIKNDTETDGNVTVSKPKIKVTFAFFRMMVSRYAKLIENTDLYKDLARDLEVALTYCLMVLVITSFTGLAAGIFIFF